MNGVDSTSLDYSESDERVTFREEYGNNLRDSANERAYMSAAMGGLQDKVTAQLATQPPKIKVAIRGRSNGGSRSAPGSSASGRDGNTVCIPTRVELVSHKYTG